MSYTNKTEFYEIPLPIGSDLYNPMDYNESMEAVDTALHTAVTNASTAVDTANGAAETATEVASGLESLSGTVNEEKGKLTALTARVTAAENEIDDVRADAQDAICSINEPTATAAYAHDVGDYFWYNNTLYRATATINIGNTIVPNTNCVTTNIVTEMEGVEVVLAQTNSDGVKTLSQILNTLYSQIPDKTNPKLRLKIIRSTGNSDIFNITVISATFIEFSRCGLNAAETTSYIGVIKMATSDSKYYSIVDGNNLNDYSSSVEASGTTFIIEKIS